MATIKSAKPSDFTGRQREEAAAAAADELAKREGQITMMQQIEVETNENEVFDPESGESLGAVGDVPAEVQVEVPAEPEPPKPAPKAKAEKATVKVKNVKKVTIQVVEDINDMTYGAGTHYTFKVGQKYSVTENIAKHLDSLGLLWGGYKD